MTITEKEKALVENPYQRKGISVFWILTIIVFLVIAGRIFYLDMVRGAYYQGVSKGNRIRAIAVKAPRGKIFDRFGQLLVTNIPSTDVVAVPNELPSDTGERKIICQTLSEILKIEASVIENQLNEVDRGTLEPILIKENISHEQSLIISEMISKLSGIALENTAIRNYESSLIFSSIIGYDGKITRIELEKNEGYSMTDYIGKAGIEKYYEKILRGKNGAKLVEVDSRERIKKNLNSKKSEPGGDIYLNLDEGLQKKLYDSLQEVLSKTETKTAAAVALDPRNGKVLALVSLPSYDNNLFARSISEVDYKKIINDANLPLFNRVVSGEYPPGSIIKPAVAAAALSEGVIDESTILNCPGSISINTWVFRDWKTHGLVDVRKDIAESCDVFFYAVGGGWVNIKGLGIEKIKKYLDLFGFGKKTGIDLPGETNGLVPNEEWKLENIGDRWYIGDSYHAAIGQGFIAATPIQLASYVAAVANGGTLYSPKMVDKIKKNESEEIIRSVILRENFIDSGILKIVREGMRQTVTSGSARSLNSLPVAVAGKTGTAQFGADNKTHGWFVSFAPYDNPEIVMVILMEGGGEGSSTAVPVTHKVLDWYFRQRSLDDTDLKY